MRTPVIRRRIAAAGKKGRGLPATRLSVTAIPKPLEIIATTGIVVRPSKALPPLPWRPLRAHQAPVHLAFPTPPRRWASLHLTPRHYSQQRQQQLTHDPSCKNDEPLHKKGVRLLTSNQRPSGHLDDCLHDGTFGGNGLGVRLVVALRLDQLHQFLRQIHIRAFQRVGLNGT